MYSDILGTRAYVCVCAPRCALVFHVAAIEVRQLPTQCEYCALQRAAASHMRWWAEIYDPVIASTADVLDDETAMECLLE